MEHTWLFDSSAITAVLVDFVDPALADQPDIRERGVRVEIRPIVVAQAPSIYASPQISLHPAVTRIDLLESAPYKTDRMHFHQDMVNGEPEERTFDKTMVENPIAWLRSYLENLHAVVGDADGTAIRHHAQDIIEIADRLLDQARQPWPEVTHDERGLVIS